MNKIPRQGPEKVPWRENGRWIRQLPPVHTDSSEKIMRRIPQIAHPLLIGALGVGAMGAGIAMRAMRSQRRQGRSERFCELIVEALEASQLPRIEGCAVEVGEGFGKPSLVSFDVRVPSFVSAEEAVKILEVATRATWDNPEIAPIVIRGRVLRLETAGDESVLNGEGALSIEDELSIEGDRGERERKTSEEQSRQLFAEMSSLGFADEIARPDELYARFGAPASDPMWRP